MRVHRLHHRRNTCDSPGVHASRAWRCSPRPASPWPPAAAAAATTTTVRADSTDAVITGLRHQPPEPADPDRHQRGRRRQPLIDLLFAGLISYKSDGSQEQRGRRVDRVRRQQDVWTVKLKDWKFTDGTPVTAESFVKAWNYGADRPRTRSSTAYFFYPIEGTDDDGNTRQGRRDDLGPEGRRRQDLHDHAEAAGVGLPAAPRLLGLLPAARVGLRRRQDHQGVRRDADRQRPLQADDVGWEHNKRDPSRARTPTTTASRKAQNGGVIFKFYTDTDDAAYTDVQSRQPRRPRPGPAERADDLRDRRLGHHGRTTSAGSVFSLVHDPRAPRPLLR